MSLRRLAGLASAVALAVGALLGLRSWAEAASAQAAPAAPALTIPVNSTLDAGDHLAGDNVCETALHNGICTLRAAVQELDAQPAGGTILLPAGTYTLTDDADGDLQLQKNITLTGAGPALSIIQGNPAGWMHRMLRVQSGANTLVSGVTIKGGHPAGLNNGGGIYVVTGTLVLSNSLVFSNTSGEFGGGIYNTGQLSIISSTVQSNTAFAGAGIFNDASDVSISPGAALTVSFSAILSNTNASGPGAGVDSQDPMSRGSLELINSLVSGNDTGPSSAYGGGGIVVCGGTAYVVGTVIQLNLAGEHGAGMSVSCGSTAYLIASRVQSNTTTYPTGRGGGVEVFESVLHDLGSTIVGNQSYEGAGIYSDQFSTLDLQYGSVAGNVAAQTGGGLYVSGGSASVIGTGIRLNQAPNGGAGLYHSGGVITTTNNVISGNATIATALAAGSSRPSVVGDGGGIYNKAGKLLARQMQLINNTTAGSGGGAINYGIMSFISSTISGNIAANGGGLYNTMNGTLLITASTMSGNQATGAPGGGLSNDGGGAITQLADSTVSGNRSATNGGGLADEQGTIYLNSVTVAGNTADSNATGSGDGGGVYNSGLGSVWLQNTILALNSDRSGEAPDCKGDASSLGYNLIQNTAGCTVTIQTSDITGQDPRLLPLGNYGGPTETRALLPGSPAIDAGDAGGCKDSAGQLLLSDQRGDPRAFRHLSILPRCDIGAFELQQLLFLPLIQR